MVQRYTSLYKTDPTTEEQEAGIQATSVYQGSPYALANVPEFEGVQYATPDYRRYQDLYSLYMGGGFPAASTTTPPAAPPGGGDSGGGGVGTGGTGGGTGGDNTYIGGGASLEDAGGTYPGGYHSAEGGFEYTGTPTSDPFLASGAAGGARLPTPTYADGTATLEDAGAIGRMEMPGQDYGYEITPQAIDPTGMLPQTSTSPFMIPGTLGVDPREKDDVLSGAITAKDAADPEGLLSKLGIKGFDAKEAAVKAAINAAIGYPVTYLVDFLAGLLPPQDPRQTALNEFYPDRTSAGTIASGLMKGYNPVSGGLVYTLTGGKVGEEPTFGLQEAYQDRIDTIENTLKDKYGMTTADIADVRAGSYKGDVDSDLLQRLVDLDEGKAKEKARLDLFSGDIGKEDTGDAMLAELEAAKTRAGIKPTNPFLDMPDRKYTDPSIITTDTDIGTMKTTTPTGPWDTGQWGPQADDIDTDIGTMKTTAPIETKTDLEKDFPGWTNAEIIQGYKDSPAGAWDTGQWGPQVDDIDTSYDVFSPEIDDAMARKGVPVYDERLGWINSVTEQPVADPNAIDSVLTGGSAEALTSHYQKQLDNIEAQIRGSKEIGIDTTELEKARQDILNKIKTVKTGPKIEPISLNTIDTSDDEGPGDSGFVGLDEDMDVDPFEFDDYGTYEPPAPPTPAPTPTPTVPDFISGGGRDRDPDPAPSQPSFDPGGYGDQSGGGGEFDTTPTVTGPTYGPHGGGGGGGGGGGNGGNGGGGGGKIVCTMMNESYGFGSFRNKIWLKHSKGLAPEYQKGYHKIFLPLVKLSKKNKLLKKTLEHIAVHRTIDIRQEARGKVHLLGRIYRKILEPICYIVGKYAKR